MENRCSRFQGLHKCVFKGHFVSLYEDMAYLIEINEIVCRYRRVDLDGWKEKWHTYDYMKPWHYLNIENDVIYVGSDYDYKDDILTQDYFDKNSPTIEKQILIAGLRLTEVLNETYKH